MDGGVQSIKDNTDIKAVPLFIRGEEEAPVTPPPSEELPLTEYELFTKNTQDQIQARQDARLLEGSIESPFHARLAEAEYIQSLRDKEYDSNLVSDAWSLTAAADTIDWFNRTVLPADPNWHVQDHLPELLKGLSMEDAGMFLQARSREEALAIRTDVLERQETMQRMSIAGFDGFLAQMIAGMADIDAPLMFVTGGLGLGAKGAGAARRAAKALGASKALSDRAARAAGGMTIGVAEGAITGAAVGTVQSAVSPDLDAGDAVLTVLNSSLFGAGFGGLVGSKLAANKAIRGTAEEFKEVYNNPYLHDAALNTSTTRVFDSDNPEDWNAFGEEVASSGFSVQKTNPLVNKIREYFNKTLLFDSDFDILQRSKSAIAKALGFSLLESSSGALRNSRSSSMLREMWLAEDLNGTIPNYTDKYKQWLATPDVNGKTWDAAVGGAKQDEFNQLVIAEMERRYYNRPVNPDVHPLVTEVADAFDTANARALQRARDNGVEGFETLPERAGYFPHLVNGQKMYQAVKAFGRDTVRDLFVKSLMSGRPDMPLEIAQEIANAFIIRGLGMKDGLDMNALNIVRGDSSKFLRETLINLGIREERADLAVEILMQNVEERGRNNRGKARTTFDFDVSHNGLSMMDIYDTDVPRVMAMYYRSMAGSSALGAVGIGSRTKLTRIKEAILAQDPDFGGPYRALGYSSGMEILDRIFSEFLGEGVDQGVNPMARRAMQVTSLATLSLMGLAQAGEIGASLAASGLGNYIRALPIAGAIFNGGAARQELAEELGFFAGHLATEYKYMRADLQLDWSKNATPGTIWGGIDKGLSKLQYWQGYISFMNQIKRFQTETLVMAYSDKVFKKIRDNSFTPQEIKRLLDEGLSPEMLERFRKKYVDTGVAQFLPNGSLDRLGLEHWDVQDRQDFLGALTRMTYQNIQKGLIGERAFFTRGTIGALLTQLKQFPLMAAQKQFFRHMAHNDAVTYNTLMLGLMSSAIAYTVRQAQAGNFDKISEESLYKGALTMSNMTGWFPVISDPVASMFGLNRFQFDDFSMYGGADLNVLPAYPVLHQVAALPGVLGKVMSGEGLTKENLTTLGRLPVIGGMVGARWAAEHMFKK